MLVEGVPLPCLKRHGSIEASPVLGAKRALMLLPCLKRHGSIEACSSIFHTSTLNPLPCLKRHGSIEAGLVNIQREHIDALTMSEKTWLH